MTHKNDKKIFRFAPSPTGKMHIGNCRTALLNYYAALNTQGEFFLRIDDTDSDRDMVEYENAIYNDLNWLGVKYHTVIKQSERNAIYEEYFTKLKLMGRIYECFELNDELVENSIYDRRALHLSEEEKDKLRQERPSYWRFFLEKNTYKIEDGILGKMCINRNWSDPIIKRATKDKAFTYNFTSAIDDYVMNVTHIIRAQEHFYNSTIQQEIIDALGGPKIHFSHLPLIINSDGHKLSKREGALSISTLREEGYHALCVISLCLTLGSSQAPLISNNIEDYIHYFNLKTFSKSCPQFAKRDLDHINKKILKILNHEQVGVLNFDITIWNIIKNNIVLLVEYNKWAIILQKDTLYERFDYELYGDMLAKIYHNNIWNINLIEDREIKKQFCIHLRRCLTGEDQGPELDKILLYKLQFPLVKRDFGL